MNRYLRGSVVGLVVWAAGCAADGVTETPEVKEPARKPRVTTEDRPVLGVDEPPPATPSPQPAPATTPPRIPTTQSAAALFSGKALETGGRCLDVPEGKSEAGTQVIWYDCHFRANQLFTLQVDGALKTIDDQCLDVPGGAANEGDTPIVWPCNGGTNQTWTYDGKTLKSLDMCLEVRLDETNILKGAKIALAPCNGSERQAWSLR